MGSSARKAVDVFVIPDVHIPHQDRKSWKCALQLLGEFAPHQGVIIGDFADLESLSHHPRNRPDVTKLALEYEAINAALDELQRASPRTRWTFIEGNHEYRAVKYVLANPHLDGVLDVPKALNVSKRSMRWRPFRETLRRPWVSPWGVGYAHSGKANGGSGGANHAAFHANTMGPLSGCRSIVYGHHHSFQMFRSAAGYEAHCCGFLGDFDSQDTAFDYNSGPTPWLNGILIQNVCGSLVTTTQIPIVNGKCSLLAR